MNDGLNESPWCDIDLFVNVSDNPRPPHPFFLGDRPLSSRHCPLDVSSCDVSVVTRLRHVSLRSDMCSDLSPPHICVSDCYFVNEK